MARTSFTTVSDYIRAQPKATQAALKSVRATLRKALPRATEGISYQIPVYKVDGRMVLYFAGYARHYAIYPATPRLLAGLGQDHEGALFHRATLRFALDRPVPTALIARVAKLRAAEAAEGGVARPTNVTRRPRKKAAKQGTKRAPAKTARKRSTSRGR